MHSRSEKELECRSPIITHSPSLGTPLINMRFKFLLFIAVIALELALIYGALRIMAGLELVPRSWF